eukprot:snap_masked-scaffold_5-processed-gene-15.16-mRNA-1 protein AED:1.00 eAED:1.00 QI:0/-1/0/0/-1/1/1/0/149
MLTNMDFMLNSFQNTLNFEHNLVLDSGASYHVCEEEHLNNFTEIRELDTPKYVSAAGGKIYKSSRKGMFEGILENGNRIILNEVYRFKEIKGVLISIAVLLSKGLTLIAKQDVFNIMKDSKIVYKAKKSENNLFLVKCRAREVKNTVMT